MNHYGFTFAAFPGGKAFCREGYESADGLISHLVNVVDELAHAKSISTIERHECHGL